MSDLTGWAKPPRALFAHYFDIARSICGAAALMRSPSEGMAAVPPDGACRDCLARVDAYQHEHDWCEETSFADAEHRFACRCGARKTEPFRDVDVSEVEDIRRGVRVFATSAGTEERPMSDSEREAIHLRGVYS